VSEKFMWVTVSWTRVRLLDRAALRVGLRQNGKNHFLLSRNFIPQRASAASETYRATTSRPSRDWIDGAQVAKRKHSGRTP
jgi:hypothetical protein